MQITKQQALSLIKILSHYNSMTTIGGYYAVVNDVGYLIDELETFILEGNESVKTFSDHIKADSDIHPNALVGLQTIVGHVNNSSCGDPGDDVEIRFKKVIKDAGEVDTFLFANKEVIGPITHVRIYDRELQVSVGQGYDKCWHYFDIEQPSEKWISTLGTDGLTFRIISWE